MVFDFFFHGLTNPSFGISTFLDFNPFQFQKQRNNLFPELVFEITKMGVRH